MQMFGSSILSVAQYVAYQGYAQPTFVHFLPLLINPLFSFESAPL
jgi:hypothetical protein